MPGIFTRPELLKILQDEALSNDERLDRIMAMRGRDLDNGYVTKAAAKEDMEAAVEQAKTEWEKAIPKPNIVESDEYKALKSEFDGYRTMQEAKSSADYTGVKGKFFETVYKMIDHNDGAVPIADQMNKIKESWPEYFTEAEAEPPKNTPQYSKPDTRPGVNPDTAEEKIYKQLSETWKF